MADLSSLDELLSSSIKSAAEPAASAGVADAIRSRLAAGDAGTTVDGPTAPGWMPPRPRWLVPLVAGVGGLAVIAAILIVMLVVGTAVTPEATPEPTVGTPTPTVTPTPTATPSPTPTPTTDPAPPPPPPPPRDQTAPTITAGQWSPGAVWGQPTPCGGTTSDIVMSFADNVGVTAVSTATSLAGTTVTLVSSSPSGSVYRFTGTTVSTDTPVTVTFTARDAAGNTSNVATSLVNAGTCIT